MAKSQFNGELIHFGSVRMRVTGTGNLNAILWALDDWDLYTLPVLPMAVATNREPVLLSNFIQQRARLELNTDAIDENFLISKIVIFVRPVASGYPQ